MRKYIDSTDKMNEIRLLLSHPTHKDNLFIVLEGETDVRLFRSLLKSGCVSFESVDGKRDLITMVWKLREDNEGFIVGICDADFDHIEGVTDDIERFGTYLTDTHDAEMMLIDSPSLQAFIDEYSTRENHPEISRGLRSSILKAAYTIGILRMINAREGLNLNFKGLNFNTFVKIDKLSATVDTKTLADVLIRRSNTKANGVTKDFLLKKYEAEIKTNYQKTQVCCGHDVTNIIAMIYSQKWASCVNNVNREKVESALRVGYSLHHFMRTKLYQKIVTLADEYGFVVNDGSYETNELILRV